VRVFTEEYQGRQGYTRRFLAATYSVSVRVWVGACVCQISPRSTYSELPCMSFWRAT
jgi:hypothetical protein